MVSVAHGSMTDTPVMVHETHEVGLAMTQATTFKSQLPTSASKEGAALIVQVAMADVVELVAYVNFEYMVELALNGTADAT